MKKQIYELFGFLVDDTSTVAEEYRKHCRCPFTNERCDGGGNRYQTFVTQAELQKFGLAEYFVNSSGLIPPGVCSIRTNAETWIVCPRRIFAFSQIQEESAYSSYIAGILKKYFKYSPGNRIGVWSEIKIKYTTKDDDGEKSFDYTFDYIIAEIGPQKLSVVAEELGLSLKKTETLLLNKGYTLAKRGADLYLEEYPIGLPHIIEVMTSSTSGGNKRKGTTIKQSFLDAIRGNEHEAPGINYRQVWARMVSQLIVKSQIGHVWGSKTLWILQDSLAHYISKSTDLNFSKLIASVLREVNILSIKYSDAVDEKGCKKLTEEALYAGEIPKITSDTDFNKLLQASCLPDVSVVKIRLLHKSLRTIQQII